MHDYLGGVSRKSKSNIMTGLFKVGQFTDMLLNWLLWALEVEVKMDIYTVTAKESIERKVLAHSQEKSQDYWGG